MDERRYAFHWGLIGDVELGRPTLGHYSSVEVYRLMQCSIRDVLESTLGTLAADDVFYRAGQLAGSTFCHHYLRTVPSFEAYVIQLKQVFKELKIGLIDVEAFDEETGDMIITVSEDLECSGLPDLGYEMCAYDEGFIAAILEYIACTEYCVKEIDCWCTGDRTCRFKATKKTALL